MWIRSKLLVLCYIFRYSCCNNDSTVQGTLMKEPNFTCVADYYNLICKWNTDSCTFWSLSYKIKSFRDPPSLCNSTHNDISNADFSCRRHLTCRMASCVGKKVNTCNMGRGQGRYITDKDYEFYLTGCSCDRNTTWIYNVTTNNTIIKLQIAVVGQTMMDTNSANFSVQILKSASLENECSITQCRVQYTSQWDSTTKELFLKHHCGSDCSQNYQDSIEINLTKLHPYTNYVVIVSCKLEASLYWSNEVNISFKTLPQAPLLGPTLDQGTFLLYPCYDDNKCLALYWKVVSPYLAQGVLSGYNITVHQMGEFLNPEREYVSINHVNNETVFLNISVEEDQDYKIDVYSVNEQGMSAKPSTLFISSRESVSVQPACVSYSRNDSLNSYLLSYRSNMISGKSVMVTYYWCMGIKDDLDKVHCMSDLDWITSNNTSLWIKPNMKKERNSGHLYFAVSLSSNNISSGMVWRTCSNITYVHDTMSSLDTENVVGGAVGGSAAFFIIIAFIWCIKRQVQKVSNYNPEIKVPQIMETVYEIRTTDNFTLPNPSTDNDTSGYVTTNNSNNTGNSSPTMEKGVDNNILTNSSSEVKACNSVNIPNTSKEENSCIRIPAPDMLPEVEKDTGNNNADISPEVNRYGINNETTINVFENECVNDNIPRTTNMSGKNEKTSVIGVSAFVSEPDDYSSLDTSFDIFRERNEGSSQNSENSSNNNDRNDTFSENSYKQVTDINSTLESDIYNIHGNLHLLKHPLKTKSSSEICSENKSLKSNRDSYLSDSDTETVDQIHGAGYSKYGIDCLVSSDSSYSESLDISVISEANDNG